MPGSLLAALILARFQVPKSLFTIFGNTELIPYPIIAWFRLKFPHLTRGSLSSSGVVNAILDFTAFDKQVAASAGDKCASVLRETTAAAEKMILAGGDSKKKIKQLFQATVLEDDGDFFYFLADSMAESVQYGYVALTLHQFYNRS